MGALLFILVVGLIIYFATQSHETDSNRENISKPLPSRFQWNLLFEGKTNTPHVLQDKVRHLAPLVVNYAYKNSEHIFQFVEEDGVSELKFENIGKLVNEILILKMFMVKLCALENLSSEDYNYFMPFFYQKVGDLFVGSNQHFTDSYKDNALQFFIESANNRFAEYNRVQALGDCFSILVHNIKPFINAPPNTLKSELIATVNYSLTELNLDQLFSEG